SFPFIGIYTTFKLLPANPGKANGKHPKASYASCPGTVTGVTVGGGNFLPHRRDRWSRDLRDPCIFSPATRRISMHPVKTLSLSAAALCAAFALASAQTAESTAAPVPGGAGGKVTVFGR